MRLVAAGKPTMRLVAALLALIVFATVAAAQTRKPGAPPPLQPSDQPVVLSADAVTVDRTLQVTTATGHVEATQGERTLMADTLTYNDRTGAVTASGNVSLMEPSGDVLFAEYVELQEGFRAGVIHTLRILMSDGARLAANQGTRDENGVAQLDKGVYTPCQSCEGREPLWQIKALRVVHDPERQQVRYSDALLEVFGVPVAYAPFFSHPDPTVKRASGFLTPNFASSTQLGLLFETPYYYSIDQSRDLTIDPKFYTRVDPVLAGEYRQRTATGGFQFDGSITRDARRDQNGNPTSSETARGHIRGDGRFDLDDTWRWGFDVFRATDDTYLGRYRIRDKRRFEEDTFGRELPSEAPFGRETLTSDLFVEGFRGRNYAAASAYSFQGLRVTDDPGKTPLITPFLEYAFEGDPMANGGRFLLNASTYSLYRSEAADTRRLSLDGRWQLPHVAAAGDIYTLTVGLRGDMYYLNGFVDPESKTGRSDGGVTGRLVPLAALEWRYPLVRSDDYVRQVIEPVVLGVVTPNGGNRTGLPNEDAVSFELDETNLFSLDRFPGQDRVESGARVTYGMRYGAYGPEGGSTTVMVGQSYRARDDDAFATTSGLSGHQSDYVARFSINPTPWFNYTQRLRFDHEDFNADRNEIYLNIGEGKPLLFSVGYVSLDRAQFLSGLTDRKEVNVSTRWWFTDEWRVQASHLRDLSEDGGALSTRLALIYQDECIIISNEFTRIYTSDRDIKPSTSFHIRVRLKNLG